jgi:hypothetical protein
MHIPEFWLTVEAGIAEPDYPKFHDYHLNETVISTLLRIRARGHEASRIARRNTLKDEAVSASNKIFGEHTGGASDITCRAASSVRCVR